MRVPSAACVPRLRDGRVLVGTRTGAARSFTGFAAFPGGTCDDDDDQLPLFGADAPGAEGVVEHIERACALRELGEETGRWCVVDATGAPPVGKTLTLFCAAMEKRAALVATLVELQLFLDDRGLVALGRWPTPLAFPKSFSVRQFLLPLETEPVVTSHNDELEDVRWVSPQSLLDAWHNADALLLPPIRHVVRALCESNSDAELLDLLHAIPHEDEPDPRLLCAGVAVEPLHSPTLPPATHTNCVLLGDDEILIVDPASPYADEHTRIDGLLDRLVREGKNLRAIVLTHHHHDHVADARRLSKKLALPIWAHPLTEELIDLPVGRLLEDGDLIEVEGNDGARWRVVFTPGHAPGHICLHDEERGVLIAGDMIAAVGSILIDPPEGHMATYLRSLERLIALDVRRVVPAHGPLLAHGKKRLIEQLEHRRHRSAAIRDALEEAGESTPRDLVPAVYGGDTPEVMWALASRSLLAELELLAEEGRATRDHDRFTAIRTDS